MSEAIVLQTYPLKESDLVVSFLTRDRGKLRGVAKRARRPKSVFGSGLERLSQVRMSYFQNPTRELVNLDSCELIHSHFGLLGNYSAAVALDYLAEISEQLLPPAESNERYFRLLLAVLDHMRSGDPAFLFEGTSTFRVVRRLSRVVLEGPVLRQGVTHSSGGVLLYPSRLLAGNPFSSGGSCDKPTTYRGGVPMVRWSEVIVFLTPFFPDPLVGGGAAGS